jgi:hypothetical protein
MDAVNSLLRLAVVLAVFAGLEARAQNDVPAREPGTQQKEAGEVSFPVSCGPAAQQEFDHAMARFHSSWYAQSIQPFTGLARKYPNCGMVYWGIALSILHNSPGGRPMSEKALKEGRAAVEKALSMALRTEHERDYVAAIEAFYKDAKAGDLRTRQMSYERAMEQVHLRHPNDMEAAVLYALALKMSASPTDKTFFNQFKAAAILKNVFAKQPGHPGAAHYLIHGCSGVGPLN